MKKIIDYQILECSSYSTLERGAKDLIRDDWQPLGGHHVIVSRLGREYWSQTMVRYEENDEN